jgi:hypothetical protein
VTFKVMIQTAPQGDWIMTKNTGPYWGDQLQLDTCEDAPFAGYAPFQLRPDHAGLRLLFGSHRVRATRILVQNGLTPRAWIEFEAGASVCLSALDDDFLETLSATGRCHIIARSADDDRYWIPVCAGRHGPAQHRHEANLSVFAVLMAAS